MREERIDGGVERRERHDLEVARRRGWWEMGREARILAEMSLGSPGIRRKTSDAIVIGKNSSLLGFCMFVWVMCSKVFRRNRLEGEVYCYRVVSCSAGTI